jgi:CBS domain-containing protein
MSPRAACRLATLGYDVYDYAPGKVDWMAHGLPIEGADAEQPTALTLIREDVATCRLDDAVDQVARRLDASPYGFALALSPGRVVLGRVRRSRLTEDATSVDALLEPGPSTVRPHTPVEDLAARLDGSDVRTLIVTDPEGRLLGVVRRGDVEKGEQ